MSDMTKVFSYVIALTILVGDFYALVLSPYVVDADTKLWLTGIGGAAISFVFSDQASSRGARQALAGPAPQTMTATGGDPEMQLKVEGSSDLVAEP